MKIYGSIRTVFYLALTALVIAFVPNLAEIEILRYFIGGLIMFYGAEEIIFTVLKNKKHFSVHSLYWNIIEILIGLTLIAFIETGETAIAYAVVCVSWAMWSILRETRELVELTEELKENKIILCRVVAIVNLLESLTVIALSFTMLIEPGEHHAKIHLYLLAVELFTKVTFPIINYIAERAKEKKNAKTENTQPEEIVGEVAVTEEEEIMNVYKTCPVLQNNEFKLRLVNDGDVDDLFKIYSDEKAVPLFNSDNCHGDDFHYTTLERMKQALDFWKQAYENGWFVRFVIEDKKTNEVIGTIEQFHRDENDYFTNCGLLRLDLRSDYEKADKIQSIVSLIAVPSFELFGCDKVATKAIASAKERIKALTALDFKESEEPLIGHDGTKYFDYYVLNK